jgi:hypothetical protein
MAELKPLGSEKLNSDDKLKRILELTYYNNNNKTTSSKAELVKESTTGGVFGIVKEKDSYYVKRGLNESSLDYIGGMFMKNKNRFSSYAEAYKRLEYIKGQEELQEATKYVLKQPSQAPAPAQAEAPSAEPSMDAMPPAAPTDAPMPTDTTAAPTDAPSPEMGGSETSPEMGGEEGAGKRSDYMAEVQKYAGKLGQELRDLHDRMESDDIKYVLNMVISAVELDKLSDEDIEEIGKKFDRDEEEGSDSSSDSDTSSEPSADTDLGEEAMNKLEEFINAPELGETSLDSYMPTEETKKPVRPEIGSHGEDHLEEIDLDEIKNNISQAVSETLSKYFKH